MSDLTVVQTDTGPSVFGTITNSSTGAPLDLSGCVVRFQMREALDRRFSVDAVAVIVSPSAGTVRYDWQPGDLNGAPGPYVSRWRIEFTDSTIEHTDPQNSLTVGNL